MIIKFGDNHDYQISSEEAALSRLSHCSIKTYIYIAVSRVECVYCKNFFSKLLIVHEGRGVGWITAMGGGVNGGNAEPRIKA
jgi:hypothetical protein